MTRRTRRIADKAAHSVETTAETAEHLVEHVREVLEEVKPKLRGWLHAATAPLCLAAGIVLVALSPTPATRFASAIFAASALVLFTVSAIMHRGRWTPRAGLFLRRLDHASIFLLIAGSYTPFTLLILEGRDRNILLSVAWAGAALGIMFRIFWTDAPRWLYVAIYIALGWAAIFFAGDFLRDGGVAVVTLLAAGGGLYTIGGVVYGVKRPDPHPAWFGFHEVFHALTIAAFITHYIGVSIATYSLR